MSAITAYLQPSERRRIMVDFCSLVIKNHLLDIRRFGGGFDGGIIKKMPTRENSDRHKYDYEIADELVVIFNIRISKSFRLDLGKYSLCVRLNGVGSDLDAVQLLRHNWCRHYRP